MRVVKESQHLKIKQDASNFISILEFKGLFIRITWGINSLKTRVKSHKCCYLSSAFSKLLQALSERSCQKPGTKGSVLFRTLQMLVIYTTAVRIPLERSHFKCQRVCGCKFGYLCIQRLLKSFQGLWSNEQYEPFMNDEWILWLCIRCSRRAATASLWLQMSKRSEVNTISKCSVPPDLKRLVQYVDSLILYCYTFRPDRVIRYWSFLFWIQVVWPRFDLPLLPCLLPVVLLISSLYFVIFISIVSVSLRAKSCFSCFGLSCNWKLLLKIISTEDCPVWTARKIIQCPMVYPFTLWISIITFILFDICLAHRH